MEYAPTHEYDYQGGSVCRAAAPARGHAIRPEDSAAHQKRPSDAASSEAANSFSVSVLADNIANRYRFEITDRTTSRVYFSTKIGLRVFSKKKKKR